jgi:DNA/RNA endonuclease G (NUC1)
MSAAALEHAKPSSSQSFSPISQKSASHGCPDWRTLTLQRFSNDKCDYSGTPPPIVNEVLNSPGQPLDAGTRAYFEPRFGHDFSKVRVHTDARAAESARAVNALAYTVGQNISFGAGQYAPDTTLGRRLLAHELTHVYQQAASSSTDCSLNLENSPAAEREANYTSEKVIFGQMSGFNPVYLSSGLQRSPAPFENTIASTPLEEAIKNIPNISKDQALSVLNKYQQFIIRSINSGEGTIRDLMSLRAESIGNYLIGGTIEVFGRTSLPSDNWEEPWQHVNAAYSTIGKHQVKESLNHLNSANQATTKYWGQLNEYWGQTEKGADRSIFALQVMEAAGAVAATALTGGGATAIAVGAGYGAAQNLAGQATSVSIGIQNKIDWEGIAFDTVFGVLTGALGGKLGNVVLKKLMGNKAIASLGRQALSEVVSDLVSGRLSLILQTSARSLFYQLRGIENLTMEQFIERLADQLMDPKAMFLDAIMGRASKMTHAASSKSQEKAAWAHATVVEPPKITTPVSETALQTAVQKSTMPHELATTSVTQESGPSTGTKEAPKHPFSGPPEGSGLELDLSGSREGWNKHIEEYQVKEITELSAEMKKPGFGEASTEKGGTEHHTGMSFHEYSPAEVAIGLRVDWDPQAGRPRKVTYNFTAEAAAVPSQATERSFHQEPRLKGESAQSREKAYVKSGEERGHLAQREAGKVDANIDAALGLEKPTGPEVERSLDVLTNVAPMTPTLNKGIPWRSAETRTAQFAIREGYVTVEITPIYDPKPTRLSDGTPIPSQFRRMIKSGLTGKVLEDITFDNK